MSSIAEKFYAPGANVLHHYRAGDSATLVGILPQSGVETISIMAIVTMTHGTDMVMTLLTADDNAGTTPIALMGKINVWKDGVKATPTTEFTTAAAAIATTVTEAAASGTYVYVFEIPSVIIPEDKYLCFGLIAGGNNGNHATVVVLEDVHYDG